MGAIPLCNKLQTLEWVTSSDLAEIAGEPLEATLRPNLVQKRAILDREFLISVLLFFRKIYNFFPQNATFYRKLIECSIEFACPMDQTPDRTYPILETFLFLITERRFGGVGAPEGREIVPDIFIQHFPVKSGVLASHYGWAGPAEKYNFSPQNAIFIRKMRLFSAKSKIGGLRTWDIRRM